MRLISRRVWVSLVATAVVAGFVAWQVVPIVVRQQTLVKLSDADEAIRETAQLEVAQRAADDQAWLTSAIDRLDDLSTPHAIELHHALAIAGFADDENLKNTVFSILAEADDRVFQRWIDQLDRSGQLRTPPMPMDLYLRWIEGMAASSSSVSRVLATQKLADLHEHALDARLAEPLKILTSDDDVTVRYAALIAAAELAGSPVFDDADYDARVPYEEIIAILREDEEPALARDAWIIIGLINPVYGFRGDQWKSADKDVAQAIIWATTATNPDRPAAANEALLEDVVGPSIKQAAAYALFQYTGEDSSKETWKKFITREATDHINVSSIPPEDLTKFLGTEDPAVRDVVTVYLAEKLNESGQKAVIHQLLWDYNDNARISGAMLAAITGIRQNFTDRFEKNEADVDLLEHRAARQHQPVVKDMMRVALWMRGDDEDGDAFARNLLVREDVPWSTLIMALLHMKQPVALDILLNPRGDEPRPLRIMLGDYQWHRVLDRYLPEDAPPFYGWASDDVQQLQIDVLRNWWLLNRHRVWKENP